MLKATTGKILPTTITGSDLRPMDRSLLIGPTTTTRYQRQKSLEVLRRVDQEITLQVANAVRRLHDRVRSGEGLRQDAIDSDTDCTASVIRTIEIKMIAVALIATRLRLLELQLSRSTDGALDDRFCGASTASALDAARALLEGLVT